MRCPVCGGETFEAGIVNGKVLIRRFLLRRCPKCGFAFVENPFTEYDRIYTLDYYAGRGADPLVDYFGEIEDFQRTVRRYEWRGVIRTVASLIRLDSNTRWLDFGCGTGGLIRYCRDAIGCDIVGYEKGMAMQFLAEQDIPVLGDRELKHERASFDVVTAIEVLEHMVDPISELGRIRSLLKTGGLFFYTTGNPRPYRNKLASWRYVVPEIHVSFFEPRTMALALAKTAFKPENIGFHSGYADIVRYKVLKNLHVKRQARWERLVPWTLVSRSIDARYGLMAHPLGRAV